VAVRCCVATQFMQKCSSVYNKCIQSVEVTALMTLFPLKEAVQKCLGCGAQFSTTARSAGWCARCRQGRKRRHTSNPKGTQIKVRRPVSLWHRTEQTDP
jgi:hypothetical protein